MQHQGEHQGGSGERSPCPYIRGPGDIGEVLLAPAL